MALLSCAGAAPVCEHTQAGAFFCPIRAEIRFRNLCKSAVSKRLLFRQRAGQRLVFDGLRTTG